MWKDIWKIKLSIGRKLIDLLDLLVMKLLGWRMKVCMKIGQIKDEHKLPIFIPRREAQIINSKQKLAEKYGFDKEWVKDFFQLIMRESRRLQNEITKL